MVDLVVKQISTNTPVEQCGIALIILSIPDERIHQDAVSISAGTTQFSHTPIAQGSFKYVSSRPLHVWLGKGKRRVDAPTSEGGERLFTQRRSGRHE